MRMKRFLFGCAQRVADFIPMVKLINALGGQARRLACPPAGEQPSIWRQGRLLSPPCTFLPVSSSFRFFLLKKKSMDVTRICTFFSKTPYLQVIVTYSATVVWYSCKYDHRIALPQGECMARTPDTRLERIGQIERRLAQRPIGWTASELAQEFAVSKPTILRDLALLQSMGARLDTRGRRYILDAKRLLRAMKVSTNELLAIYLAVRLLSRHSDEHNPHVVTAMEKLAEALQVGSPLIARHIEQAAKAVSARKPRTEYVRALEALTQGWAEGKKVRMSYHSYTKDETTERTFAPFFIEPSGIGYSTYVIGHDDL